MYKVKEINRHSKTKVKDNSVFHPFIKIQHPRFFKEYTMTTTKSSLREKAEKKTFFWLIRKAEKIFFHRIFYIHAKEGHITPDKSTDCQRN